MSRHVATRALPRPTRRAVTLGGSAAIAATALAACNPGGSGGGGDNGEDAVPVAEQDAADFAGKTLSYLYFTDGPDEQATRDLIAQFEQEYDVTVELEIVPFSDLTTTLQARLSGGQAPDVARVAATAPFAGDLLLLDDYLGAEYLSEFSEGVQVGMTDADGRIQAIASDLTQNGPFVNTDLFEQAGVEVPQAWTWEEMVELATQVQEATGTEFAFAMDKSGHRLSTILSQGGTYLVQDGTSSLDPAAAATALQPLVDMIEAGTSPSDFWLDSGTKYQGANEVFLAQQVPVYLSGNWQVAQFDANASFGWTTTPNPTQVAGELAAPYSNIDNLSVFSTDGEAKIGQNISVGLAQVLDMVKSTTGVDFQDTLQRAAEGGREVRAQSEQAQRASQAVPSAPAAPAEESAADEG